MAIRKLIFNDDVKALKKYPSNYNILFYPNAIKNSKLDKVKGMWPDKIQEQSSFYAKKDKYGDLFERCSRMFCNTLNFIEKFLQIELKIILTANIDYWQDYPWIAAIHIKKVSLLFWTKNRLFIFPVLKKE